MSLESLLRYLPAKFSPETSMRAVFLAISLALAGVAWLGIAYGQQRLADLRGGVSERTDLLEQQEQLRRHVDTLENEVAGARSDCEFMIAKLPNQPAESEFLTLLSDCATKFNVTVGDYRPGSVQSRPSARHMELSMRASGSYTGLCQWLDHMSQLPRLVHVHHLTLIGPASPGGECTVDLQLTIVFGFAEEVH